MISIAHKIELIPNNKQKTYFHKAFGCARLAYNWGLAEWQRRHKDGEQFSMADIRKSFNAIKKEQFPFVREVTKYATQQPFINLDRAYTKFFSDLKNGIVSYPKFKRKKDNYGSFYMGGDIISLSDINKNLKAKKQKPHNLNLKYQYLKVQKMGWVKMTERLRFKGKINSVTVSKEGDRYYASFNMFITEEEYKRTHPHAFPAKSDNKVGIDLGTRQTMMLSDGVSIENPRFHKNNEAELKKLSRQMMKRTHAKNKQEKEQGIIKSKNFQKSSLKLCNKHRRISNRRYDFIQKLTTILVTHYGVIAVENLNVNEMMQIHRLSTLVRDVSFSEICRQIEYKSAINKISLIKADRFFPSSKTCSVCGKIKCDLQTNEKIFHCQECGTIINRDYNASLNLLGMVSNHKIGTDYPKSTPEDLMVLLSRFEKNGIATSKVDTGRRLYCKSFKSDGES